MELDAQDLEQYRRLDTRRDARAAFDRIVGRAQRSLQIFDDSGEFWGLDRAAFADLLRALLARRSDALVTIVVHDPSFIERHGPRLLALLRRHTPRLRVLRSDPAVRSFSKGLVIADATVVLRRPHFDQPRAFLDFDEPATTAAGKLFDELVAGAQPGISANVTGL